MALPAAVRTTLAVVVALAACSDGGGEAEILSTREARVEAEAICTVGADLIDSLPPAADLAGLAAQGDDYLAAVDTGLAELRDLAGEAEPGVAADLDGVVEALAAVRAGGAELVEAAAGADPLEVVEAAQAAEADLGQLDQAAAELRVAACNSETWGRRLFIVAVELASP